MNTTRVFCAAILASLLSVAAMAREIEFKPLRMPSNEDTFVDSGLKPAARKEIFDAVAVTAYDTPESWDAELRVHRQRVGPWLVAVVRGTSLLCGATGDCQTWLFRLDGSRWVNVIASGQAPIVDALSLTRAGRARPWRLVTRSHVSAEDRRYAEYRFDGRVFQRTRCRISAVDSLGQPKGAPREAPCS